MRLTIATGYNDASIKLAPIRTAGLTRQFPARSRGAVES